MLTVWAYLPTSVPTNLVASFAFFVPFLFTNRVGRESQIPQGYGLPHPYLALCNPTFWSRESSWFEILPGGFQNWHRRGGRGGVRAATGSIRLTTMSASFSQPMVGPRIRIGHCVMLWLISLKDGSNWIGWVKFYVRPIFCSMCWFRGIRKVIYLESYET